MNAGDRFVKVCVWNISDKVSNDGRKSKHWLNDVSVCGTTDGAMLRTALMYLIFLFTDIFN